MNVGVLKNNKNFGFTLIEMIISIALFSFVMLAVTTVLLSVVDANHKAQGIKTTINNLSLSLESMTRNLRTGKSYTADLIRDRGSCDLGGVNLIGFSDQDGILIQYSLGTLSNGSGAIMLTRDGNPVGPMTAPEINIDRLCFYVKGQSAIDSTQPQVLVTIGGVISSKTVPGAKLKTSSRFDIETLVSQRFPDIPQI
jgi:prepilin-type N-terminal cleavage/methylation domain-containing protein